MDIQAWLRTLGLERYEQAFRENGVDEEILPRLTAEDLKDIGVTAVGHRRKLLDAIASLRQGSRAAVSETSPETKETAEARAGRAVEAERRQLTIMFVDLIGSTALSNRIDPEEMREVIRAYQNAVAGEIARFEGHVAQFMGDGVLAYFGWPRAHEDEAERAVRTGLAIVDSIATLVTPAQAALAVRVGIATGLVVVGDLVGEGAAQEEAVVGETPNLAARLQALAEPGRVVISEATRRLLGDLFDLTDLGFRELKGLATPVRAWRVNRESRAESRFEALHGLRLSPLVGREHELALLLDRWEQAKGGEGQVVLLSGEPGIGKSRIALALRQRLGGEELMSLRYYGSPYHTNSALFPIIDQIERAAGFDRNDAPADKLAKLESLLGMAVSDLETTVPLIGDLLVVPAGGSYPPLELAPEQKKAKTFQALLAQLEGLATKQPVLMIAEDVHWFDPTSLELFELMIERIERLPALLVITFRPEFAPRWTGRPHVALLTLNRLGRADGAALIGHLTGGRPLPANVLAQILSKTEGVPLFIEEVTKAVLEAGFLREAGERYELTGPLPAVAVPATLHDSLMARLDRQAPIKAVAQIAAVIGREFSYALISSIANLDNADLTTALDELVRAELVFRRGEPPNATYAFKHALVRDAAYQSLLKTARVELHARIAGTLERRFPSTAESQPELLAHHYDQAGALRPAISYWLRAGEHAARRSAHVEAIAHLRRGLALVDGLTEAAERARTELDLQTALGASLMMTLGFAAPEAGEAFDRAYRLAGQIGEVKRLGPILQGLCSYHTVRGDLKHTQELAERALITAQSNSDVALLLTVRQMIGGTLCVEGDFDAARAHFDAGLPMRDQAASGALIGADVKAFLSSWATHALWHLGCFDQAARLSHEAMSHARTTTNLFNLALALDYAAMLHQFGRTASTAEELATEAIGICTDRQFAYYLAWATTIRGWARSIGADDREGLTELQHGLDAIEATGARFRRSYFLSLLAEALGHFGKPSEALEILARAMTIADASGEHWRDSDLYRLKGRLLLHLSDDRSGEAEACFRQSLAIARGQHAKALELTAGMELARLWHAGGKSDAACELLGPICDSFSEGLDAPSIMEARALLADMQSSSIA
ncbi:adenylate/guanylate cyclase domain-containing protein [Dongia deserti]|uniref:adenylate/guanylate cyclase domain-containing protein n=1 Tax=Dongia deserti TaxID=2268030 RepID=UPI002549C08F|nr:adenylate/guanylate cyclase domain-containing protein [Dongia deserti]